MKLACFTVLFLAAAFRLPAGVNLLSNGSFETGDFTGWVSSGDVTVSSSEGVEQGTYSAVFNGNNSAPNGSISQTFTTVSGQQYVLDFFYGDYGSSNPAQALNVTLTGTSSLLNNRASLFMTSGAFTEFDYNFTANSTSTTLEFADATTFNSSQGNDGVLDNVSVTAVPETNAAWTGFGALLLAVLSKRRFWQRSQPSSIVPSVSP